MAQGITPVFSHHDFLIFDKPEGISFHSESGTGFFAGLQKTLPDETLYPVHRLDKMTSGLVVVARNKKAAQSFSHLFANHSIHKTYIALSDKKPTKKQGRVAGDMTRTRNGSWKLNQSRQNPAITRFTSEALAQNIRLFILKPETGRSHQLRVMMKALGSPILGDLRYGGSPADRAYLHATALDFIWKGEQISCFKEPRTGHQFRLLTEDSFHRRPECAGSTY